jgi:hypothetical protein
MRLILALLIFTGVYQSDYNQCELPPPSTEYVASFDLVATGYTASESFESTKLVFNLDSVFRGDVDGRRVVIDLKNSDFKFQTDTWYLVYAKMQNTSLIISKCSRSTLYTEAFEEIKFLSKNVKCIDKTLIQNGACPRSSFGYICGCDGRNYGSLCEARRNGIAVYATGRCEDRLKESDKN